VLPLRQTVGLHTWSQGELDRYNVPATVHTPAKDQPGTPYKVFGWTKTSNADPSKLVGMIPIANVDVDLYAPPGFPASLYDLIDLPDGQYEVVGAPKNDNYGPFGYEPGVVVQLRRIGVQPVGGRDEGPGGVRGGRRPPLA
jgi:hypothetical protein